MVHCKRGVTLRSTAEWEKENTPTHTHSHILTYRGDPTNLT